MKCNYNLWWKIILVLLLVQKVQGVGNRCFSTACSSWLCCVSGWETCRELIIHRPVWTAGPAHTTITHTHIPVYYVSLLQLCILLAPTHGGTRGKKWLYTLCTCTCTWDLNLSQTHTRGSNYLKLTQLPHLLPSQALVCQILNTGALLTRLWDPLLIWLPWEQIGCPMGKQLEKVAAKCIVGYRFGRAGWEESPLVNDWSSLYWLRKQNWNTSEPKG